uniref:Prokineticin-2 n=1 Tax=Rhinopithecus roxellana TaxID=61622 RepID=A0A2K6QL36_RHIRO
MSDSETTKAIPARAKGGGWATAEGTARSGAPRGERCLRGARGGGAGAARSTCSSGNRPIGDAAVITGACDKDSQCGGGMCCAVSIWVKSIRICTPMGKLGDSCHPLTRKNNFGNGRQERRKRKRRKRKKEVPFFGRRMHHTCPCLPGLACLRTSFNRFICLARK